MDGIMGAGPIGDMGRAVERATANMSPDQKQEYLRQAALSGIDPRVNNIALLQVMSMQLDRLKQPQAQPPQGGTVRQQLNQAVMMKDRQEQEAALRAQIAESMQRRAAEQMPVDQGLGGLDTGSMERAEYAGGGIIGYDVGGFITKPKEQDPFYPEETLRNLREQTGIYDPNDMSEGDKFTFYGAPPSDVSADDRALINDRLSRVVNDPAAYGAVLGGILGGPIGIPVGGHIGNLVRKGMAGGGMVAFAKGGTPPKKTGLEALIASQEDELKGGLDAYAARTLAAQEALREKYGVGKDSEYDRAMQEEIARLQEQAAGYGERAGREDLASYFFNVAAEASKPGATFIGSYAKAAPGYAAARKQTQKDVLQVNDQARTAKLKMLQAKDLERRGDVDNAFKLYNEGKKEYADAVVKYEQIQSNRAMVNAQMSPKGVDAVRYEAAQQMQRYASSPDSPEYKNAERLYNSITPGIAAAGARGANKLTPEEELVKKRYFQNKTASEKPEVKYVPKEKERYDRMLEQDANFLKSRGIMPDFDYEAAAAGVPATSQPAAGGTDRYSGFTATPIR